MKMAQRGVFFLFGSAVAWFAGTLAERVQDSGLAVELGVLGGILTVLVLLRIFRGPQWRWLSYASGALAFEVLLLLVLVGPLVGRGWLYSSTFDAAAWQSAPLGDSEVRIRMVDDLLKRPLIGLQAAEVDRLLGPDDSVRGTGFGAGYWDEWDRVWWLGPDFMRIDSEWLVLRVSSAGVVLEARLVRD